MGKFALQGYLTPRKTLEMYGKRNGGAYALKLRLADDLRSGRLEARARLLWVSDTKDFIAASKEHHKSKRDFENAKWVSVNHWNNPSSLWAKDQMSWDWEGNRFFVTNKRNPKKRTFISKIYFPISRLNEILISSRRLVDLENMVGEVGHPGSQYWDELWLQIIDLAKAGRLQSGEFQNRNALTVHLYRQLRCQMSKATIRRKLNDHFAKLTST